jgi:hypothetical protein
MGQGNYRVADIQRQLDDCAKAYTFPMLDNGYVSLADVRLYAYRDETRWALIIEHLGFHAHIGGHNGIVNCLYRFGNCLDRAPGVADQDFIGMTFDGPDGPTFADDGQYVRDGVKSLRIRGHIASLDLSPGNLMAKGITLQQPPRIRGAELLRALTPKYRDFLLATEDELRQRVPADLPEMLVLDEWHHPDLAKGMLPSASNTFRMLSRMLVGGDPAFYKPTEPPNTHWKYWPNGGTL